LGVIDFASGVFSGTEGVFSLITAQVTIAAAMMATAKLNTFNFCPWHEAALFSPFWWGLTGFVFLETIRR
jgi:hypothetical protein